MAQDSWKVSPGRRPGPELPIEDLLTQGYQAHAWMNDTYRREPPSKRIQKGRFCTRLNKTRPSVNRYLKGGGIPFPFPPLDHLVWVVDVDDRTIRWVSPSLCSQLQADESYFVGQSVTVFRGGAATPAVDRDAVAALIAGDIDVYECQTTFTRVTDGCLLPLKVRVTYGDLYRVWFGEGSIVDDPSYELAA